MTAHAFNADSVVDCHSLWMDGPCTGQLSTHILQRGLSLDYDPGAGLHNVNDLTQEPVATLICCQYSGTLGESKACQLGWAG